MSGEKGDFLDQMMGSKSNAESDAAAIESEAVNDSEAPGEKQAVAAVETTVTTPEAAPPAAKSEPEHVPIAAVMAEREKRQKYERELADTKRQLEEIQAAQQKAQQLPEFFADPEGYVQTVAAQVEFRARDRMFAAMEEEQREAHTDFDQHFEAAMSEAQQNPAVAKQILSARNPAKAAYELGKRMSAYQAMTVDPAKFEADMRAKLRAEWEAEQATSREAAEKAAQQAKLDAIPEDLASERSSSAKTTPKVDVFDQLFPRKT